MWSAKDLFVLSDLHLAGERDAGLFQSDAELADCLTWILEESQDSLAILAGDTLDFLIPGDGETKTDFSRLGDRTQTIIEHHPEVFEALSNLVCSSRHKLIIMGGDHDSELVFPAVQEVIEQRLGIEFSNPKIRWLVQGEVLRLRVGNTVVLIEHGNVLDPWNRIEPASLHSVLSLASRNLSNLSDYKPPTGSRLALEVIAALRNSHHWIDWLKPETETVLPLVWQFGSRKEQALICSLTNEYLDMKEVALNKKIGNLRRPEMLYRGDKEAEDSERDEIFKDWFDYVYEQQQTPLDNGNVDAKLIEKLRSVSAQDTFFDLDKPDSSVKYLQPTFESGADLVIHGHTHSAKASAVEGGFYINTGTWGQLLQLPKSYETDDVWRNFLALLRRNEVASLRRPTLARVRHLPEQDLTRASLLEWQKPEPRALTTRRFSDCQTGWRRED
jgi:UDP-2,3-diacylglucosamine pyrophosphatase LpxH